MKDISAHIISQFSLTAAQEFYIRKAEEGLWPSEEAVILKYFKQGATILDLGCGTGRTTIPLFHMRYNVIGVDVTPAMIENATKIAEKKGFFIKYQVGDATNLRFADNIFDGVFFSNQGWTQIFGKENRLTAFREIHRVLKPKGYFLFTTHVRKWRGFTFFWFWQWVKLHILKPFGFPIDEEEW